MTSIRMKIGGTGGTYGRYSALPTVGGALFAAYALGRSYHGGGMYPGTPVTDLSGHGRHGVAVGDGMTDRYLAASSTSFVDLPFSTAALAARTGEATLVTIAASPDAQPGVQEIGAMNINAPGSTSSIGMIATTGDVVGGTSRLSSYVFAGGQQINLVSALPRAADTFEFHAASFSPGYSMPAGFNRLYRRRADMAGPETLESNGGRALDDTAPLRIGSTVGGPDAFSGQAKIPFALVYDRKLTLAEMDEVYGFMKALLGKPQFDIVI